MPGVRKTKTPLAYTVNEALALLPFKRNKFYAEVKSGRLPIKKVGRMTIILEEVGSP